MSRSFVNLDSDIRDPHFRHVWRDSVGKIVASVGLGDSSIHFRNPADARATAAACIEAAEAMEKMESETNDRP